MHPKSTARTGLACLTCAGLLLSLGVSACEKHESPTPTPQLQPARSGPSVGDETVKVGTSTPDPANTGTLIAKAKFVGAERPRRTVITNATCEKGAPVRIPTETWVVSKDMEVANVVVFVKDDLRGDFAPPATPAQLDQHGCQYVPHVQSVMVGQSVKVTNSDDTLHNIHSFATKQRAFNFAQTGKGASDDVTFTRPEFVRIKCDVHAWMNACIAVFDHPFHAVTDLKGQCTIANLPAGSYTVGAWHEETDELAAQTVTIAPGSTATVEFGLK